MIWNTNISREHCDAWPNDKGKLQQNIELWFSMFEFES